MFYAPKLYIRDPWILFPLVGTGLIQAFIWWYVLSHIHPSSDPIFLHYTILFGVDLIGNWQQVLIPPSIGLGLGVFNYLFSFGIYGSSRLVARLMSFATVFIQLFLAMGVVMIVGLSS